MTFTIEMLSTLPSEERDAILFKTAAMPHPAGLSPNFENPVTRAYLPIAVTTVCLLTAVVCALLRAYSRIFCQRKIAIEDGLGLVALVLFPPRLLVSPSSHI
jgi:hypothetical protein